GRALPASRRPRGRGVQHPGPAVGRGGLRGGRAADGGDRGRAARALPRRDRRLQTPQADRAPDGAAAEVRGRQGAQARAAGTVLGWAGGDGRRRLTATTGRAMTVETPAREAL